MSTLRDLVTGSDSCVVSDGAGPSNAVASLADALLGRRAKQHAQLQEASAASTGTAAPLQRGPLTSALLQHPVAAAPWRVRPTWPRLRALPAAHRRRGGGGGAAGGAARRTGPGPRFFHPGGRGCLPQGGALAARGALCRPFVPRDGYHLPPAPAPCTAARGVRGAARRGAVPAGKFSRSVEVGVRSVEVGACGATAELRICLCRCCCCGGCLVAELPLLRLRPPLLRFGAASAAPSVALQAFIDGVKGRGPVPAVPAPAVPLNLAQQCRIRDRSTILARQLYADRGDAFADKQVGDAGVWWVACIRSPTTPVGLGSRQGPCWRCSAAHGA